MERLRTLPFWLISYFLDVLISVILFLHFTVCGLLSVSQVKMAASPSSAFTSESVLVNLLGFSGDREMKLNLLILHIRS
uniref:Uncharacterized protein n=1 Tax=Engystomops pustulosus TaxID=76066 RepID=A0AAV6YDU0_ENGPU|nr:hypothetical protein GDO81_027933 [Engystomops pustulosus]